MGMQITNLTAGSGALPPVQDNREKRVLAPAGQNVELTQVTEDLPDSGTSESMNLRINASALDQMSANFDRKLQFVLDQDSREITVKVIDRETDRVIKVLPPEELQRLHSGSREAMGFLFDSSV